MRAIRCRRMRNQSANTTSRCTLWKHKGAPHPQEQERKRKRVLSLNDGALVTVKMMIEHADEFAHTKPEHYLWCAKPTPHTRPDETVLRLAPLSVQGGRGGSSEASRHEAVEMATSASPICAGRRRSL